MFEPKTIYAKIAFDAVLLYMKTGKKMLKDKSDIPAALQLKLPCFVSIYSGESLRASKGTVEAIHDCLYNEIIENAVSAVDAATKTDPLKEEELDNITLAVDVLSNPREVENRSLLKPEKHGIIVKDEEGNSSFVLPNMDGIETVDQQIKTAKDKAGIDENLSQEKLHLLNFTVTRYQ